MLTARDQRLTLRSGRVRLISDTHGLLRPEALAALKGSELIIHARDIRKPEVLESLTSIAPLIAIRGRSDRNAWAKPMPNALSLTVDASEIGACRESDEYGDQ